MISYSVEMIKSNIRIDQTKDDHRPQKKAFDKKFQTKFSLEN